MIVRDLGSEGLMTLDDAGQFLGLSLSTVRNLVDRHELPATRIGRSVRLSRKAVVAYANQLLETASKARG